MHKIFKTILIATVLFSGTFLIHSQPEPGDVYKEFTFIPESGSFSELDPDCKREFTEEMWINKPRMVIKTVNIELENSVKAEMSVEYWGGHIGTSGQKFKVNGNEWIEIPQPENTPSNPLCYHRTLLGNNHVSVPLEYLKEGRNEIQFTCGPQICYNFNFGFYWIYSFTIRIYYYSSVPHAEGKVITPAEGKVLDDYPEISLEITENKSSVRCVDFIGFYEDFDWEGNGNFSQWHFQTRYGKMYKHIGSSNKEPYSVTWNTKWLPDQNKPMRIAAIITDTNGYCFLSNAIDNVLFKRTNRKVRMYTSYDVPEAFAARIGQEKKCAIDIGEDIENARSACLLVSTWSGKCNDGSAHEILINGRRISDNFGRFHDYSFDYLSVPVDVILQGKNEIKIHSLFEGHGLEVNWPGPVLLVEF